MITELTISQKDLDFIQADLDANKPYEACGVIIGTTNGTTVNVKKVVSITNVLHTTVSFELDPKQFYDAWNDADKNGNEIVGIYHSHPVSRGVPSSWDRDTMKNFPSVWLIAGADGTYGYIYDNDIKSVKILTY